MKFWRSVEVLQLDQFSERSSLNPSVGINYHDILLDGLV